ncbi:YncE family protein [Rhodococcus sp. WMMA185]|uniref:YncE family protein n=1 Tax=Rhodococcus sp. WMMA185 TaxID=679318 RepID=UPI0018DB260E|nr:hypothetical protein [Rhodococcus sp. WMMA185]
MTTILAMLLNNVNAAIPVGETPTGIAITPDGAWAYVTNRLDGSVSVIAIDR